MSQSKAVAVTGASGFVGRHVCAELAGRGHRVRALTRSTEKAREAETTMAENGLTFPKGSIEWVVGDVCDSAILRDLLRDCSACAHLVGIIREVRSEPGRPQTFERMHVRATAAVTGACEAAGVRRYLHMSAIGVSPDGRAEYQTSKWAAEVIVRRTGLDWTIFRPSLIHGPDGEFIRMIAEIASGEAAPFYFIPYFVRTRVDQRVPAGPISLDSAQIQPVAVTDVARAFTAALDRPETIGEVYNLVGSEVLTWPELLLAIRDEVPATKKGMSTWHIPGEHAAVIAHVAKVLGLGGLLPFDRGQALMACEDTSADAWKAEKDLGMTFGSFREGLRGYAALV